MGISGECSGTGNSGQDSGHLKSLEVLSSQWSSARRKYGMSYIGQSQRICWHLIVPTRCFFPSRNDLISGAHFWQDLFWALRARRGAKDFRSSRCHIFSSRSRSWREVFSLSSQTTIEAGSGYIFALPRKSSRRHIIWTSLGNCRIPDGIS